MSLFITLVFTLSVVTGCFAVENSGTNLTLSMEIGNPVMTVNGTQSEIDPGRGTAPVIQNGRTLVPIRAIVEDSLGQKSPHHASQHVAAAPFCHARVSGGVHRAAAVRRSHHGSRPLQGHHGAGVPRLLPGGSQPVRLDLRDGVIAGAGHLPGMGRQHHRRLNAL